jgi:hypothetical protein
VRSAAVIGLDEDSSYRTPSVLSIVSLVLGIVAPVALFAPLLLVIPIAGCVLALMAVRQISSNEGMLIGRTAACLGLALSIAAIVATVTRSTVTETLLSRQARAVAVEWFDLLQSGDVEQAFELTTASRQPTPKPPPGAPESAAEPQVPPLETFRADPVVHFLLEHAQKVPVEYLGDEVVDPAAISNARVQQIFEVAVPAETGAGSTTSIELILQRSRGYGETPAQWLVAAYRSDDLLSDQAHDEHAGHVH